MLHPNQNIETLADPGKPPALKAEILVAEDSPLNREVVRVMLGESEFTPIFAANGQDAVAIYAQAPSRFQVILMDVTMPIMGGHDATKTIREIELVRALPRVPIIALTGHALGNDRKICLDAGMDDYLSKPVRHAQLIGKLRQHLNRDAYSAAVKA